MFQNIRSFFTKREWIIIIIMMIVIMLFGLWMYKKEMSSAKEELLPPIPPIEENKRLDSPKQEEHKKQEKQTVMVDIKGLVQQPGVYEMNATARVNEAIEKAGGFLPEANKNQINLASIVQDEMVIYVPKMDEGGEAVATNAPAIGQPTQNKDGKIPINTATAEELQKIPGIGPAKAEAIIAYRNEQGPFKKVEDLLEVSGIGEKSLEKMKEHVVIR